MKFTINIRIVSMFLILVLVACSQNNEGEKSGAASIEFEQIEFDFGTIAMGEKVVHRFAFKNSGQGNLYIKQVSSDCGCTVVDYEKKAIPAGSESFIEAQFDSNGMPGLQIKSLTVYSNANDSIIKLTVSASVDYSLEQNF